MRDPKAKQMMARLALTYDRLAEFAALREASEQNARLQTKAVPRRFVRKCTDFVCAKVMIITDKH